jgi:NodT family efflux transporter outer membrane factor (OMF) lipoprotein
MVGLEAFSVARLMRVLALASGLLAGCAAVGPDFKGGTPPGETRYVPRELALERASPDASSQHVVPGQQPAARWWTLLGSDELNGLVEGALANNRSLAAAQATLAQAQQVVTAQAAGLFPQVDLQANVGRQKLGAQFLGNLARPPPFTFFSIGPAVSYALDYTGGIARSVEQQRALAEYQRQQLHAAYLSVTGNVALQSLAIAAARAQIAAIELILQRDRDNLNLVRTAFDLGSASRVDVLAAESQLARDTTLLPPVRQQLDTARHTLAILAGQPPGAWSPPDFDLRQFTLPRELPLTYPSQLAHERPDILAAEAQLHAATAGLGVATANLYPRITLTASLSKQSTELSHLFDGNSTAWSLISGLVAPIFDAGRLRAQRSAALYALHASAANYQQVVLQAFGQVADVLTALETDAEAIAAETRALEAAQASADLTRQSYQEGVANLLQVLDADRLVQQARLGLVRAESQRYIDTVQLFLALGAGPAFTPASETLTPVSVPAR